MNHNSSNAYLKVLKERLLEQLAITEEMEHEGGVVEEIGRVSQQSSWIADDPLPTELASVVPHADDGPLCGVVQHPHSEGYQDAIAGYAIPFKLEPELGQLHMGHQTEQLCSTCQQS